MINQVTFPGLGLEFELNRVAFPLFGHDVYWYGIIIACGFALAVVYCYCTAYRFGIDRECIFDMLIFAVPLSILGARAYYVIFYLDLFKNADGSLNWGRAIAIGDGGLAIYGAVIVAVAVVVVFCRVRKMNTLAFLDMGCYGLLIGQIVGRWGNFMNVEAYGSVTKLPWRMAGEAVAKGLWRDGYLDTQAAYSAVVNGELGVHPTFLYESLWNLVGFALLIVVAHKWRKVDGQMFLSYMLWYGVGRFFIEGLRTDSLYFFNTGIRTSQMLALVFAVGAAVWLVWRLKHAPPAAAPFEMNADSLESDGEEE